MMNKVGFVSDIEDYPFSYSLEYYMNDIELKDEVFNLVVDHLENKGHVIMALMSWVFDPIDKSSLGPHIIYTDGEFIWTSYYLELIKKYRDIRIEKNFVDHVSSFVTKGISIEDLSNIHDDFEREMRMKHE